MIEDGQRDGISVHAGFPNAATDRSLDSLDLHQLLVPRPNSMFLFRIHGDEWAELGIFNDDIAVIDRALSARPSDLIVWWHDASGEFAISRRPQLPDGAAIWGVVTSIAHQFR